MGCVGKFRDSPIIGNLIELVTSGGGIAGLASLFTGGGLEIGKILG